MGESWATVNAQLRILCLKDKSLWFCNSRVTIMKMLFFRNYYFIENLQLKIKSSKDQRKKKRNCRLREKKKTKRSFFGGFLLTFKAIVSSFTALHSKKAQRFLQQEKFHSLYDSLVSRMKMRMLPKIHYTTEAERGENPFFFVTCDAVHLTCFDELSRRKNRHTLFRCKIGFIFCDLFFHYKKKTTTEISNLGS